MAEPTRMHDRTAARPYWRRYDATESGPSDELVELICSRALVDSVVSSLRVVVDQAHVTSEVWDASLTAMLALVDEGERLEELVRCFSDAD